MPDAPAPAHPDPAGTRKLRLDIAYDGTDFHGWAKQPNTADPHSAPLRTVQGVIEEKLSLICQQPISLTVAGRTDAGVHATGQVAHCQVPAQLLETRSVAGDPGTLVRRLARLLPADVRVTACSFAPEGFDARFSALHRTYHYRVSTAAWGALPTRSRDTASWPGPVDLELMNQAAAAVVGLHDFAAFCRPRPGATTIRDLQEFRWEEVSTAAEPHTYRATVRADAFCWNMVRSLVGMCLAVGAGKRPLELPTQLLNATGRSSRIPVAPACGLTLVGVSYPPDKELAARAENTRELRCLPCDTPPAGDS